MKGREKSRAKGNGRDKKKQHPERKGQSRTVMMAEPRQRFWRGKKRKWREAQELKVKRDRQQQSREQSLGLKTSGAPREPRKLRELTAGGTGGSFMKSKTK